MALAICSMQRYDAIDPKAPFAAAFLAAVPPHAPAHSFVRLFYTTSARFVSFGAATGAPVFSGPSRCGTMVAPALPCVCHVCTWKPGRRRMQPAQ